MGKSHGLPHMLSPTISLQSEQLLAIAPWVWSPALVNAGRYLGQLTAEACRVGFLSAG